MTIIAIVTIMLTKNKSDNNNKYNRGEDTDTINLMIIATKIDYICNVYLILPFFPNIFLLNFILKFKLNFFYNIKKLTIFL